jgi:hypothetical protein
MTTPAENTDYDSSWKAVLERYFPQFLEFFFPQIYAEIDWERGWEFLDKELQQVVRDADLGKRLVDKLVKVWRKDGTETFVLIHLEVQGQVDLRFAERMFEYHYRLHDRYHLPVVNLAVLADERTNWRPTHLEYSLWGCQVSFDFPVVKLLDYKVTAIDSGTKHKSICSCGDSAFTGTGHPPESRRPFKVEIKASKGVIRSRLRSRRYSRVVPVS